ncbi:MAG: nucleotidyltransferase domain-containing protein [Petrimonas sp.]|nr:nucleotidyltransferase domain-containing protein [Petrimonas sp.]
MTKRENIISQIRELKQTVLPEGRLLLFGSQARGDATPESDWDLLILLDKKKITSFDFDRYAFPFVALGWKLGEYFSPKLYTTSEWDERKNGFFYKNVQSEGVEL